MIKIDKVTKMYGQNVAVKDVSFEVGKGEILGFLGPNGAGKTTMMRVITGFFPPTGGNVFVDGHSVVSEPLEVKKRIGYVPENPSMYKDMRVYDYLKFISAVKGVPKPDVKKSVEKTIETCSLGTYARRRIGELSKGYRQRLALAQALVNDPPVLILDEPTSGLDPKQIHEIRELIKSMGGEKTVVLSTHILPEVSMTCSKVVIINDGEIVAVDSTENIGQSLTKSLQIEMVVEGPTDKVVESLSKMEGIEKVKSTGITYIIDVEKDKELRALIARKIVESGYGLLEMKTRSMSLEDIFLRLVTEEEGGNS
ncbi:MAG TPA: ATP-binding cassette domain-containing protein [Spirochaetes bacterium]|nr:ATP-binding cassette domain-containing protein [Spirochaetota bacterium]